MRNGNTTETEYGSTVPAVLLTIALCALIMAGVALTAKAVKTYNTKHTTELAEGGTL